MVQANMLLHSNAVNFFRIIFIFPFFVVIIYPVHFKTWDAKQGILSSCFLIVFDPHSTLSVFSVALTMSLYYRSSWSRETR